jgi:hypothetical protein
MEYDLSVLTPPFQVMRKAEQKVSLKRTPSLTAWTEFRNDRLGLKAIEVINSTADPIYTF